LTAFLVCTYKHNTLVLYLNYDIAKGHFYKDGTKYEEDVMVKNDKSLFLFWRNLHHESLDELTKDLRELFEKHPINELENFVKNMVKTKPVEYRPI